jgi:hypothetical protein
MLEFPVCRAFMDARVQPIVRDLAPLVSTARDNERCGDDVVVVQYGGTNEIMKELISRTL